MRNIKQGNNIYDNITGFVIMAIWSYGHLWVFCKQCNRLLIFITNTPRKSKENPKNVRYRTSKFFDKNTKQILSDIKLLTCNT